MKPPLMGVVWRHNTHAAREATFEGGGVPPQYICYPEELPLQAAGDWTVVIKKKAQTLGVPRGAGRWQITPRLAVSGSRRTWYQRVVC